ncbi:hypothetical protein J6590_028553 [Homalodisca vitripennis]|nr:hypothetical protein J6590_028553 [Homalodisca vitripennis]
MTNAKEPQYSTVGNGCNNTSVKPRRIHLYTSVVILNIVYLICGAIYAWSSPVLVKLKLSDSDASTIASTLSLGAMAGPLISGALVDRLGRKGTVALNMGFMTGSCLLLTATRDVMLLSVGRFMSGVSWGISFSSIPLYIAEISEDSVRGVLNTALIISVATGSLFMYAVGPFVSYAVLHYILVGLCIFFFFLFPLLPNSPYALVMNNQTVRARDTLSWLRENRSPSYVENELQAIQKYISENQTNSVSVMDLFTREGNRRALTTICTLLTLQQLCGVTIVLFYMQNIFEMTGADLSSSTSSLILGLVKFAAGFVCPIAVKSYGYKKPLIVSLCGTTLGMGFFTELSKVLRTRCAFWANKYGTSLPPIEFIKASTLIEHKTFAKHRFCGLQSYDVSCHSLRFSLKRPSSVFRPPSLLRHPKGLDPLDSLAGYVFGTEVSMTAYYSLFVYHLRVLVIQKTTIRALKGLAQWTLARQLSRQWRSKGGAAGALRHCFKELRILTVVAIYIQETILLTIKTVQATDSHNYNTRHKKYFLLHQHHLSLFEKKPSIARDDLQNFLKTLATGVLNLHYQRWYITNRKCQDSGVQGQFDRSSILREMTVGVCWGSFSNYQRCCLLCLERLVQSWPPLLLEGHDFEISALILPHGSRQEAAPTP